MELTQHEVRLIQRHRTVGHRIFRWARNLLALASLAVIVLFFVKAYNATQAMRAYEAKMQALGASAVSADSSTGMQSGNAPEYIMPATRYATLGEAIHEHEVLYERFLDSIGLSADVQAFTFYVEVLPVHADGFRSCYSQMNIFADCGCDKDGVYGFRNLEINPTLTYVRVVPSRDKVTLAEFKTLNRQPSGLRR